LDVPPGRRAELSAKSGHGQCELSLPDLTQLRLIEPLDCAWIAHTDGIWGCAVSQDGRLMLSASRDGDLAAWDMETGLISARARTGQPEIRDCDVSPDNRLVVSMHAPEPITVFGLPGLVRLGNFPLPSPVSLALSRGSPRRWRRFVFSPDGSQLAVAGSAAIDSWSLQQLSRSATLRMNPSLPPGLLALSFSPCGASLTAIGRDRPSPITTWEVPTRHRPSEPRDRVPGAPRYRGRDV
jgi:WD40 repeat protein